MNIIKCEKNEKTNGICANFICEGKYYYADLCPTGLRSEVTIFPADENFEVTSWEEVYLALDRGLTSEILCNHIANFEHSLELGE